MEHSIEHSSPSDNEVELPRSHPARRRELGGKNDKKRGWGEAMELAHQRDADRQRHKDDDEGRSSSSVVAVDLNQFRNTEVGIGYKARHVVRQKTATAVPIKTKTINNNYDVGRAKNLSDASKPTTLEELLRNDGLRAFRKEIEKILSS